MADINELMRIMAAQMMSGTNAGPEARRAGADVPGAYRSNSSARLRPELLQALLAGSRGPQVDPFAGVSVPPTPPYRTGDEVDYRRLANTRDLQPRSFEEQRRLGLLNNPSMGQSTMPVPPSEMQSAANRPADWHHNLSGQVGKFDSAQAEAMANRIMDDDSTYETEKYGKIVNKQAPTTPHPSGSGITPNLQDRLSNINGPQTRNVAGWFGHEVVDYEDGTRRVRCLRPDLGCEVGTEVGEWYSGW